MQQIPKSACPVGLRHASVAILLRGESFRTPGRFNHGCSSAAIHSDLQTSAWRSVLIRVVEPLEESCGGTVRLFATLCHAASAQPVPNPKARPVPDPKACEALQPQKALSALFGERRIGAISQSCHTLSQADSMRTALQLLKEHAHPAQYDLVLITRHDIVWLQPITTWGVHEGQLSFAGHCERRCAHCRSTNAYRNVTSASRPPFSSSPSANSGLPQTNDLVASVAEAAAPISCATGFAPPPDCSVYGGPPQLCMADVLQTLPGRLFRAFDEAVGSARCFNARYRRGSGHGCFNESARLGAAPAVLKHAFWPKTGVREQTPFYRFS